jgi:hypothetical protein
VQKNHCRTLLGCYLYLIKMFRASLTKDLNTLITETTSVMRNSPSSHNQLVSFELPSKVS